MDTLKVPWSGSRFLAAKMREGGNLCRGGVSFTFSHRPLCSCSAVQGVSAPPPFREPASDVPLCPRKLSTPGHLFTTSFQWLIKEQECRLVLTSWMESDNEAEFLSTPQEKRVGTEMQMPPTGKCKDF